MLMSLYSFLFKIGKILFSKVCFSDYKNNTILPISKLYNSNYRYLGDEMADISAFRYVVDWEITQTCDIIDWPKYCCLHFVVVLIIHW